MKEKVKNYFLNPIWFHVVSFFFIFFQVTGYLLAKNETIIWTAGKTFCILAGSVFFGIVIGNICWRVVMYLEDRKMQKKHISPEWNLGKKKGSLIATGALAVMLLCWLPLFLAYYPGICAYDFAPQIIEFITSSISTHHPVLHTLLVGKLWLFGFYTFESGTVGIAIYTCIQMGIMAICFLITLIIMYKMQIPKKALIVLWLFFCIYPLNGYMALFTTKDGIFSAFLIVFFSSLLYLIKQDQNSSFYKCALLFLAIGGIGSICFRNNTRYAYLALLGFGLLMCIFYKPLRALCVSVGKWLVLVFVIAICLLVVVERNYYHNKDDYREFLSVPLQQMARVVNGYKDELDEDVVEYLEECFSLGSIYNYKPELADPIKDAIELRSCIQPEFVKTYLRLFVNYPGEYVNAWLALNAGYLYLNDTSCYLPYVDVQEQGHGYIMTSEPLVWMENLDIYKESVLPDVYEALENILANNTLMKIPILRQLLAPGIWLYIFLYAMAGCITLKKYKYLLPLSFVGGYYVTLILGPIVLMRYIYPMILCGVVFVLSFTGVKRTI